MRYSSALLCFILLFCGSLSYGQQIIIKGKISGPDGAPLPDVSVSNLSGSLGAVSDENGLFSIALTAKDKQLVFSHIGMATDTVAIQEGTDMNVRLAAENKFNSLSSVVVIGYGTQKQRNVTGAVGIVKSEAFENQAIRDVADGLQGQMAGVVVTQADGNPSSTPSITIRGLGTFGASPDPLVVVDGIITNYGLRDINPFDIDNVSVLKDASAAAIYGSRGANGVVLVTTKKGKRGHSDIDVNYYFGMSQVSHEIPVLTGTQFATIVNEYYVNGGSPAPFTDPSKYGQGTNWQKEIFQTAPTNNVNVAFRGGSEKSTYSVSLGALWTDGVVINSTNTRYTLSVNNEIIPIRNLKVSNTFYGSNSVEKEGNPNTAVTTSMQYAPTIPAYNPDGSFGIASQAGEPVTINAPLVEALVPVNHYTYTRLMDNLGLEYQILPGLKFRTEGALEYFQNNNTSFIPAYDFGLGNQVATSSLTRNINYTTNLINNDLLSYSKGFGDHAFDVMVGYTFQDSRYEYLQGYRENFSRTDSYQQVLDAASANDQARGNITDWTLQSYIGRLNYAFKNRYLFNATMRIDQSSRFEPSHNTGYFPSFSVGWIISDEPFMNKNSFVSFLKLRGGWGELGNQDIGIYPYQSTVSSGLNYVLGNPQGVVTGYAPTSFVNQNISWEKTATTGVGVDANFINNRLRFIGDFYRRNTTGILLQVPIPAITGNSNNPAYQNAGAVTNTGFELTVGYGNLGTKSGLTYNFSINFTDNHNNVTSLNNNESLIYADSRTVQGHAINSFYGYKMQGIFQNQQQITASASQPNAAPGDIQFMDLNGDHVINDSDRTFLGSSLVQQTFGFTGQLQYHHFDFNFVMISELGAKGITRDAGFDINRAGEQNAAIFLKRWTGPGTSNDFPRLVAGDPNINERPSDFYLASRDFVRLKNVQLGYNIPTGSKIFRSFRIYVAAQNLFTITKWPGFDPELSNLTSSYPLTKSYYAGVNIGF